MKRTASLFLLVLLLLIPVTGAAASAFDNIDLEIFALIGINVVENPHRPFTIDHDEETEFTYLLVRESGEHQLIASNFESVPLTMIISDADDEDAEIFWNFSDEFILEDSVTITLEADTPYLLITSLMEEADVGALLSFELLRTGTAPPKAKKEEVTLAPKPVVEPLPFARKLVAGPNSTFFIADRGALWATGSNKDGLIGQGSMANMKGFTSIMVYTQAVSSAGSHTLVLGEDGRVWAMGNNEKGQLGDGTTESRRSPKVIIKYITEIAAGAEHSLFIDRTGTVLATGSNSAGQLGVSSSGYVTTPVVVAYDFVQVWTNGESTSYALKEDGTLYGWGSNSSGELGLGHSYRVSNPTPIAHNVSSVAAGKDFTYVLHTDGTLASSGDNSQGQLGDGTEESRMVFEKVAYGVVAVAAGERTGFYIDNNGQLWAAGSNSAGQWGIGSTTNYSITDGFYSVIRNVQAVAAGVDHAIIQRTDGKLYSAGANSSYQLGDQSSGSRSTWVEVL